MSAKMVEKLGVALFVIMTSLTFVCIAFGFFAVYQAAFS